MSHAATSEFFEALRTGRLLDDDRIDELRARPESTWGDLISVSNYAQERGWLTPYQIQELREGRGSGLVVGGYRIFDKVNDGPAGATYKALHPALHSPVSLRLLKLDWLAPADTMAAYLERTHAATLVQSPHVVTILDAGTHGDAPYVVQDYLDGCDLFRLVNEMGALPVGLACEYTRQAALAVKAAHDKGVSHGDVTPYSLFLTPVKRVTGMNGDVSIRPRPGAIIKLAELALSPQRPPIGELSFGQSDRVGHVEFLPPERITSGERTPAGDLYGLGATMYFLLTTRPPQGGTSAVETLLNLQNAEPLPIESIKPDVPPTLAVLIRQLLSRDVTLRAPIDRVIETLLPFCEPSAMPGATPVDVPVLVASETMSLPSVPDAIPVAKNLDRLDAETAEPFAEPIANSPLPFAPSAEQPLVEPMSATHLTPEVHPLDEHHDGHQEAFEHTAMGADKPRAPRPKVQATGKNKAMIIAGLVLHLTGTCLCLGFLGIIPNPFAKSTPSDPPKVIKNVSTTPSKGKNK
ncbi:MAG TPA: serine/threonine-protein kinase [Gemmataceae bacterium]|jgi:serine/threonine-protein kinase|nr:serine/threonine-protein kinase [Gemmataceae bacterium]